MLLTTLPPSSRAMLGCRLLFRRVTRMHKPGTAHRTTPNNWVRYMHIPVSASRWAASWILVAKEKREETCARFDHVQAMLRAWLRHRELHPLLPYACQFYGSPSTYSWVVEQGHSHDIVQGKGGEQGDPLMPAPHALAHEPALRDVRGLYFSFWTTLLFGTRPARSQRGSPGYMPAPRRSCG